MNIHRIILSFAMLAVAGGIVVGGTGAFFSDEETSTGNVFAAGELDLRVDSVAHFNSMVCTDTNADGFGDQWQPEAGFNPGPEHYPQPGDSCNGTWVESDLIPGQPEFRFFDLADLKPGDEGENTISLHVTSNDAWGCMLVDNVVDEDNTCTEPETESTDPECNPSGVPGAGELGAAITFDAWLDEGSIAGFQCNDPDDPGSAGASCPADLLEGDNILNGLEQLFWTGETIDEVAEGPFPLSDVFGAAYAVNGCTDATGDTDYAGCHGLALDGRMVGSATYYFGLAWNLPDTVGNEVQSDRLVSDMIFEVEQHRNNPDFVCTQPTGTLTVTKVVVPGNDPTPATEADFPLFVDGQPVTSGVASVQTTGAHVVSETNNDPEYTAVIGGDCDLNGNVVVTSGGSANCTITNTYMAVPGELTIAKTVINDEGGTAVAGDFTPQVNGVDEAFDTTILLTEGTYTVTETGPAGYTPTFGGACDANGDVIVTPGAILTCTIENNDDPTTGTLTITKTVVTNDGGDETQADFTPFVDGVAEAFDTSIVLAPGTYAITETGHTGYTQTFGSDCVGGSVTITAGVASSCTITNDDIAPEITLVKDVAGGQSAPDDFLLTLGGGGVLSGIATPVTANVAHAIDETELPTYIFTGIAGVSANGVACPAALAGTITLDVGDTVTCTITNEFN